MILEARKMTEWQNACQIIKSSKARLRFARNYCLKRDSRASLPIF